MTPSPCSPSSPHIALAASEAPAGDLAHRLVHVRARERAHALLHAAHPRLRTGPQVKPQSACEGQSRVGRGQGSQGSGRGRTWRESALSALNS